MDGCCFSLTARTSARGLKLNLRGMLAHLPSLQTRRWNSRPRAMALPEPSSSNRPPEEWLLGEVSPPPSYREATATDRSKIQRKNPPGF